MNIFNSQFLLHCLQCKLEDIVLFGWLLVCVNSIWTCDQRRYPCIYPAGGNELVTLFLLESFVKLNIVVLWGFTISSSFMNYSSTMFKAMLNVLHKKGEPFFYDIWIIMFRLQQYILSNNRVCNIEYSSKNMFS